MRAGTGGDEAALFAADLFRMYSRYAELRGWKVEIISISENDLGGYREIVASISGEGVFARLKFESGVHRVQRIPATETGGRIHTSAATVAVLPEAEEVDVVIRPEDVRIDTMRAGGAGGQHVNKTDSAVRMTHLPTGIMVVSAEKSQHQNRRLAMQVLRSRVYELERERVDAARASARKGQIGSGDRSQRIRTYNFPQGRVTDHRINMTLHKLDTVLEGARARRADRCADHRPPGQPIGGHGECLRRRPRRDWAKRSAMPCARRSGRWPRPGSRMPAAMHACLSPRRRASTPPTSSRGPSARLSADEQDRLQSMVARRCAREPVSRILGVREFYGRPFALSPATLDPRPDSETLIGAALDIAAREGWRERPIRILDIGTGSGCLLLTLLAELPLATGVGTDICGLGARGRGRSTRLRLASPRGSHSRRPTCWTASRGRSTLLSATRRTSRAPTSPD